MNTLVSVIENTDDITVIRSNSSGDFQSATPTLMSDDSWGYTAYANNGFIYYTNDKFISPGTSLAIEDWWTDTESLSFNQIDITSYTDVDFSIGYASNNQLSANDKLDLITEKIPIGDKLNIGDKIEEIKERVMDIKNR